MEAWANAERNKSSVQVSQLAGQTAQTEKVGRDGRDNCVVGEGWKEQICCWVGMEGITGLLGRVGRNNCLYSHGLLMPSYI